MLKLNVKSENIETGMVELEKVIDHDDHKDRAWLGKHCFWAFRNGRKVTTWPAVKD